MSLLTLTRSCDTIITRRSLPLCRHAHTPSASQAIINIPKANVYRFGDSNRASPVFKDLQWTVHEGECWAVIGAGRGAHKTNLLQMLLGHLRISPSPPAGLFPFLAAPSSVSVPEPTAWRDPSSCISIVSFAHRPRSSGGEFYDYTARYGAVREEDRVTLRQSMFPETSAELSGASYESKVFSELSEKMDLQHLLDLPLVALSNGQTRRARILKALLSKPELLLLDEPLTGLDAEHRTKLLSLLHSLHASRSPRFIMGLRSQDPIPEWITHVALVEETKVTVCPKDNVLNVKQHATTHTPQIASARESPKTADAPVVVDLKNVSVAYHERQILKNIHWTIRAGDRYHLQGSNGSGKTTLLALLTGDHPQSYTQFPPTAALTLFGRPRPRIPTPELATLIGAVSPELTNAFPRRANMSVWDAVGTGFDGGFVSMGARGVGIGLKGGLTESEVQWRVGRMREVFESLGPHTWAREDLPVEGAVEGFSKRAFVDLSAGEQSVVLLMRALVGRPRLLLLDEVWSGMDDGMIAAARAYLRGDGVRQDQAVVVISHWVEEVPWGEEDGVKRFRLENGQGQDL